MKPAAVADMIHDADGDFARRCDNLAIEADGDALATALADEAKSTVLGWYAFCDDDPGLARAMAIDWAAVGTHLAEEIA